MSCERTAASGVGRYFLANSGSPTGLWPAGGLATTFWSARPSGVAISEPRSRGSSMRLRPVLQTTGLVLLLAGGAVAVMVSLANPDPIRSAMEVALVSVADQYDTRSLKSLSNEELVRAITECLAGERGGDFVRAFNHACGAQGGRYQRMSLIALSGLVVALAGMLLFMFATTTIHRRESPEYTGDAQ